VHENDVSGTIILRWIYKIHGRRENFSFGVVTIC